MAFSFLTLRNKAEEATDGLPPFVLQAQNIADAMQTGRHDRRKKGGFEKFWQYREYASSDRPQDIDWRKTAQGDQVFVREKELQNPLPITVHCNRGASMDFCSSEALQSKREAAQVLCLALALVFAREGERVSVSDVTRYLMEDGDLALDEKPRTYGLNIVCSDFLDGFEELKHLREALVIQVLDPAELSLPYKGHTVFEGLSSEQRIEQVRDVRAAYQDKINAHLGALQAFCAHHGFTYALHVTDQPVKDTLLEIAERLQ